MENLDFVNLADCDPTRRASKRFRESIFGSHASGIKMLSFSSLVEEKHAASRNGGIVVPIGDELKPPQMCTKAVLRFDCKQSYNMWEQLDDDNVIDGLLHSVSSFPMTTIDHSASALLHDANDILLMPKKPKSESSGLSPWHKEVTECAPGLQYMSKSELYWAQAVNCLIEKVCTDVQCQQRNSTPTAQPQPRLALTTRLMQQIFPLPSRLVKANATASHEKNVYIFARSALIDACKLMCFSRDNSIQNLADGNMMFKEPEQSEKDRVCSFTNVVENCLKRLRKLENDFVRCKEGCSTLDLRMECHDLEKHSTIIRFARFHGEAQTEGGSYGVEISIPTANSEALCQRHLTVDSMPQKLPTGQRCLLL
ncbi:hypothetical protein Cni_G00332 [Canna indica]|uniref:Uncharacterized protein n=1 Tax=Canna indica TaxID=4628 RepID=A0AAQ3JKR0_9LILI|nr:hypothetical protein Cni_G00332 [Canna indica]